MRARRFPSLVIFLHARLVGETPPHARETRALPISLAPKDLGLAVQSLIPVYHGITVSNMRTTVTLDDDVFEAAKAQAEASGKKLGKVLSQLARRGLRPSPPTIGKAELPVFKVRADAEIIPSNRAKKLLADDAT